MATTEPPAGTAAPVVPGSRCDLVMQGGITSGVVYPGAIRELARSYSFHDIGGASAGAIAAVAAAAAEYGRKRGRPDAGFAAMDRAVDQLREPGFLLGLFQPVPEARRAFVLGLRLMTGDGSLARRSALAAWSALRPGPDPRTWLPALAGVVAAVGVPALAWLTLGTLGRPLAAIVLAAGWALLTWLLLVFAVIAGALVRLAGRLDATLNANGFGLCPGTPQPGSGGRPALTWWLHDAVQAMAGLEEAEPLTFGMLQAEGIDLKLVTTDLNEARPVMLPLTNDSRYLLDMADLRRLLPEAIVGHLESRGTMREIRGRKFWAVPPLEMPVTLGARLSLSFPILLSAVPLYTCHSEAGGDRVVRHWMSDGGITSNFPIHLFDAWLPRHPTFGLSLQPAGQHDRIPPGGVLLSPEPRQPRRVRTAGLLDFFSQVFDAARNWRDTLQAELPNSRDRVCQIFLEREQGGLNLDMSPVTLELLLERGRAAGKRFTTGHAFDWDRHRVVRYQTFMQMMQIGLHEIAPAFDDYQRLLAGQAGLDPAWCQDAVRATAAVVAQATRTGPGATGPLFNTPDAPRPTPVMRICPDA